MIRQVAFVGRPLDQTDRGAVEIFHRADGTLARDQEALAVVEQDSREVHLEGGFAAERPGGTAEQHIDLAGLEQWETGGSQRRDEHRLVRIAQRRRRDRAAEIHLHPRPAAILVRGSEPHEPVMHPTAHDPGGAHALQGVASERRPGPFAHHRDKRSPQRNGGPTDPAPAIHHHVFVSCRLDLPSYKRGGRPRAPSHHHDSATHQVDARSHA